jgi:formylglycine-generating enzyme required for sulfatase activity
MEVRSFGCVATARVIRLSGGLLRVGLSDWEAQGVVSPLEVNVSPFGLDALEVTEERYAFCVAKGACAPLALSGEPGRAVSGITADEAARFCEWAGGALPTGAQLAFAASGATSRRYPWGDTGAVCRRAAWGLVLGPCGWDATGPELAGSHPDGASREGVLDLAGNVAEWAVSSDGFEVRGGSFHESSASSMRGWQRVVLPRETRSTRIGVRCAYR